MIEFNFETTERNEVVTLKLSGSLMESYHGVALLKKADDYIALGKNKFVLDMEGFDYMNSSGLSVIISLLTKARKNDGDVVICNINKKNNDILVITKLNSVFSVCDTEADAISAYN